MEAESANALAGRRGDSSPGKPRSRGKGYWTFAHSTRRVSSTAPVKRIGSSGISGRMLDMPEAEAQGRKM